MFEIFSICLAVFGSLGGGAAIIYACSNFLGKLWAQRLIQNDKLLLDEQLEKHKIALKKSVFIFQKEFEAASEFVELHRSFYPKY